MPNPHSSASDALLNQQQPIKAPEKLISERRRTAFRLREAAKAGGIGTWYWSFADTRFEWDESMYELYQLDKSVPFDALYPYWLNMISYEQRVAVADQFQQAMRTKGKYSVEFTITLHNGRKKYIRSSAVPYFEEGSLVGIVGSDVDMTGEKEREAKLLEAKRLAESANHAKGVFLANMSHEIRTPLNGIIGLTDLTLQTELTSQQRLNLQRVFDASKNLLSILNDILDYSKMEAGMMRLESAPFSLSDTLQSIIHVFSVNAEKKGLSVELEQDEGLPAYVAGDVYRLTQVLNNLLGNAIKFTQQGKITLGVKSVKQSSEGMLIRFSVQDTGIGISHEKQQAIFNAFSQEDASITRLYGGTGLGLAIAKQLVELMQGQLHLHSELNFGSHFWFELPLTVAQAPADDSLALRQRCFAFRCHGRILLCEDNPVNQAVALGYLEGFGCEVDVAHNGLEGVSLAKQQHYDLILMDLQMPVMDGYEASMAIRQFNPSIPIVALSAAVLPEERAKVKQAQMNGHLAKPIDVAALQQTLRRYMLAKSDTPVREPPLATARAAVVYQHINLPKLLDAFASPVLVNTLLTTFARHYAQADQLFDARQPLAALHRQLHSLKGAAGNLHMSELQQEAQRLFECDDENLLQQEMAPLIVKINACIAEIDHYQSEQDD